MKNKMLIEAETIDELRQIASSKLNNRFKISSETIINPGSPVAIQGEGFSIQEAFAKLEAQVPKGAVILSCEEIRQPGQRSIDIEAFDEETALKMVSAKTHRHEFLNYFQLTKEGKRGFLGLGKSPHVYHAIVLERALAQIVYKEKASGYFTFELDIEKVLDNSDIEGIVQVIKLFEHDNWEIRNKAINAFGHGEAKAIEVLGAITESYSEDMLVDIFSIIVGVDDINKTIKDWAINFLTSMDSERALERLIDSHLHGHIWIVFKSCSRNRYTKACKRILDILFGKIRRYYEWSHYADDLANLFGDYTGIILDLVGYDFDGDEVWIWDTAEEGHYEGGRSTLNISRNMSAISELCSIHSPVSNNLLHELKGTGKIEGTLIEEGFSALRRQAIEELNRRMDPKYNSSIYLEPAAWKRPR